MLIENNFYPSSVHCSYYAMLQHMTCKLQAELDISFEQLASNSEDDIRTSHKYLLEETIRELTLKANKLPILERNIKLTDLRNLKRKVKILKALRVESDYHDIEIDSTKSEGALASSIKIISELDIHFS